MGVKIQSPGEFLGKRYHEKINSEEKDPTDEDFDVIYRKMRELTHGLSEKVQEYHYIVFRNKYKTVCGSWCAGIQIVIEGSVAEFICTQTERGHEVLIDSSYQLTKEQYDRYCAAYTKLTLA